MMVETDITPVLDAIETDEQFAERFEAGWADLVTAMFGPDAVAQMTAEDAERDAYYAERAAAGCRLMRDEDPMDRYYGVSSASQCHCHYCVAER